jgi:Reverse transcriptase (RNA-dependent DNA polymerase)
MIGLWVDDLIIIGRNLDIINDLKKKLNDNFDMKDLKDLTYFLGLQVIRDRSRRTLHLNQTQYIQKILQRFNMDDCKPVGTPMDISVKLIKAKDNEELFEILKYQSAVGSLMYGMLGTRPDITFAISAISRYNNSPTDKHWTAVKRVLRYLKGTHNLGITLGGTNPYLRGYCDSDWGGDLDTRKSTTGYIFMYGDGAISYGSKHQRTIALSSTEAEYMALCQAAKEALWLQGLLTELGRNNNNPIPIFVDNQGCMALAKNPQYHQRTKHIDIQHHFIREKVENQQVELHYCPTEDMIADILTKPLSKEKHNKFRELMRMEFMVAN